MDRELIPQLILLLIVKLFFKTADTEELRVIKGVLT
jgi:hypothetical protein